MTDKPKSPVRLLLNKQTLRHLSTRTGLRTGVADSTAPTASGGGATAACASDVCASAACASAACGAGGGGGNHDRTYGCMR